MPEWEAEIEVDEHRARALIGARFRELDVGTLRRLGEGWDNTVWLTGDGVAFRFPRRAIAIPGIDREIAILPQLAPRLPAAIPDARYVGVGGEGFPWPWFGSRVITGREIADAALADGQRTTLAADLGRFLGCLHALDLPGAGELAIDPMGRADMTTRVPRARAALERASRAGAADRLLGEAESLAVDDEAVLVHGDLNLRHALVADDGGLAGVIDWGDMCRAPRSVDLALYWSLFDAAGRAAFRAAYGPIAPDALLRARVLALFMDATLVVYARDTGMDALARETERGLDRTLTD